MAADSAKPNKLDKVVHIDQQVGDQDTKLDIDLTGHAAMKDDMEPDLRFGSNTPDHDHVDVINSNSRSLISRPGTDITVSSGRRDLDRTHSDQWTIQEFEKNRVIHPDMDNYSILNEFRQIRTNILRRAKGKNQVVLVVSLQHHMGASFCSVNIAASFAYEGEKTALLIECDQRKRTLETIFPDDNPLGLTDFLDGPEINTEDIIHQTSIRRMRFIPIGRNSPGVGEYFSSTKMRDLINQLKKRYDDRFIVLKSSPLEITTDAAILSEVADQIVVVIPYGKVSNQRLSKALKLLPKPKITGIVVNDFVKYF